MSARPSRRDETRGASPDFPPTRWSVVGRAGAEQTRVATEAMDTLYRAYEYPIYAFLRRSGHLPHDAQDWTQGFFEYVIENEVFARARQEKGRFRSFLLASLKNFISTERRRLAAQKRGGGRVHVSLDDESIEERYAREPAEAHTPETLFELSWMRTLLAQADASLEKESAAAEKRELFTHLRPYLQGGRQGASYAETAAALGKSEDAIKSAVLRLRQRFQQLLRDQVARTVMDPAEIQDELRHLREVLSR